MTRIVVSAIGSLLAGSLLLSGCSSGRGDLSRASSQLNFGVKSARMNLWREALFRFRRAAQLDPQSALVENNLAVAYEGTGEFEKAREAYVEALRLDRSNEYIQKNYSRFTEFYARNKKRDAKAAAAAAAMAADSKSATTGTAATGTAAPLPPGPDAPPLTPKDGPPQKPVSLPPSARPEGGSR